MQRSRALMVVLVLVGLTALLTPVSSQDTDSIGQDKSLVAQPREADAQSIFNDQVRKYKFLLENEVVTTETAEAFMLRYQRPDNPRIIGAYPDVQTNALVVIGPPEAEQAIRESLAQWLVDGQGQSGAPPLALQLRILQHERTDLLLQMADLEVQEVAAAAEQNGAEKARQLAARRQMFEDELKIAEQQIRIVRKYMARLEAEESVPATAAASAAAP